MPIFSAITSKIFGAVSLALLLLLTVKWVEAAHWHKLADQRAARIAQVKVAQDTAQKAVQAAHDAQEARYKELANASQATQESRAKPASDATDSYANAHRVREQAASCPSSPAVASAPRVDPGIPASLPASTDVVISNADLHACTNAYVYALGAHDFAATLATNQ